MDETTWGNVVEWCECLLRSRGAKGITPGEMRSMLIAKFGYEVGAEYNIIMANLDRRNMFVYDEVAGRFIHRDAIRGGSDGVRN